MFSSSFSCWVCLLTFGQDLSLLLRVLLSLTFAPVQELGWDPTIRPLVRSDGERIYRIDVGSQTFETNDVLTEDGAEELVGHATRVWRVTRPGSDEHLVLKDVWVEDGCSLEHAIYEEILRDVEDKYGPDVRKEVASHLLTPVAYCLISVGEKEDHTTGTMMRGFSPSFRQIFKVDVRGLSTGNSNESDPLRCTKGKVMKTALPWYNPLRRIIGRRHYRIVFKEVARTLQMVSDFADVFTVLSDCAKGKHFRFSQI